MGTTKQQKKTKQPKKELTPEEQQKREEKRKRRAEAKRRREEEARKRQEWEDNVFYTVKDSVLMQGSLTSIVADLDEYQSYGLKSLSDEMASDNGTRPDGIPSDELERRKTSLKSIHDKVSVTMRGRSGNNGSSHIHEKAVIHIGPTNSGKSYRAIEALSEAYKDNPDGTYVYAGPLRMLAWEVYNKLADRFGKDAVGFLTGEEQINEDAHIKCCTVEMAPMEGDLLVLDEAHWLVDQDRGHYWTDLLVGGDYNVIHAITAEEASDMVMELLSDFDDVEVDRASRLIPLVYQGGIGIKDIGPHTAVVAFSRKAVWCLARMIQNQTNLKAGVIYGRMPLEIRAEQIAKYLSGEYDVMVTTDVIGHGINLPIDSVVFAETEKFDGEERRELAIWEAAQIAGRAGRYGLSSSKAGSVWYLSGVEWATPSPLTVSHATAAAAGKRPTDLKVDTALVTPKFADIGVDSPSEVALACGYWKEDTSKSLKWKNVSPANLKTQMEILSNTASMVKGTVMPWLSPYEEWCFRNTHLYLAESDRPAKEKEVRKRGPFVDYDDYDDYGYYGPVSDDEYYGYKYCKTVDELPWNHCGLSKDNWHMSAKDLWNLINAPINPKGEALSSLVHWLNSDDRDSSGILFNLWLQLDNEMKTIKQLYKEKNANTDGLLESLESIYASLEEINTMYICYGSMGTLTTQQVDGLMDEVLKVYGSILDADAVDRTRYGLCQNCGRPTAPWFRQCDECHRMYRW